MYNKPIMLSQIQKELKTLVNPEQAKHSQRFFKTGKGEYGENDIFLGLCVGSQRKIAQKYYKQLSLKIVEKLLQGKIHEYRLTALFILVYKYEDKKTDQNLKKQIFDLYLKNTQHINNWDLVDLSAPKIVGFYLLDKPQSRKLLYKLAKSNDLWKKRIAILATHAFIRQNQFDDTLKISKILLGDNHDLIHKAVGWMLREIGKRDQKTEEKFLKKYYGKMPRTMLRYAIEKFEEKKRKKYLNGKI